MPGKLYLGFADYGGEKSGFQIATPTLSAGNFAAVAGTGGDIDDLEAAIADVTIGLQVKKTVQAIDTGSGVGNATDPYAQRELKWLISYHDTTTNAPYQCELPCPKLDGGLLSGNPDGDADLTDAAWVAFIAAFEQVARSPTSGVTVIDRIRLVGRNI